MTRIFSLILKYALTFSKLIDVNENFNGKQKTINKYHLYYGLWLPLKIREGMSVILITLKGGWGIF